MTRMTRIAAGLLLATSLGTGALVAPAFAKDKKTEAAAANQPRKFSFSKKVQKLLAEAQTAQAAGDHVGAIAKLNEAKAIAETVDDRYMANLLTVNSALATQNNALVESALAAAVESGGASPEDKLKFLRNLSALALQRNDTARATQIFEQMAAENPQDGETLVGLGEMYYRNKQSAQAVATIRKAIAAQQAKGISVPETWYKRALALAYDGKLTNEVTPASIMLVTAYPTANNWRDSLVIFRDGAGFDDQGNLDVMRLMHDTKSLSGERDYFEYAETANTRGLPGEAKRIIDEGVAKGALSPTKLIVKELTGLVSPKLKGDQASLAGLEREAKGGANGRLAKATADGYLSYGQNDKAAELYRLALQKGGIDAAEANTRLGIALARNGDKAGAETAFKAVTTGKRAQLAQFWLAYLAGAGQPAATTTAATTTG